MPFAFPSDMVSRVKARNAFMAMAIVFITASATLLWISRRLSSLDRLERGALVVFGVALLVWSSVGPGRMGLSKKRFPNEVRSLLRVLGLGGASAGVALMLTAIGPPSVAWWSVLVAAGSLVFLATVGILRMRRSLPTALTLGEIYSNAKSAGVFGGATADNSTMAFNRWAPEGADGVPVGAPAPDGPIVTLEGQREQLSDWLARDPEGVAVLNFGSYTCPHHRKRLAQLESVYERWRGSGVRFLTIYTAEAHPKDGWDLGDQYEEDAEYSGNPDEFCLLYAKSIEDRQQMAEWLIEKKAFSMPTVLDSMQDTLLFAYNSWPIRLYVIQRGQVAYAGAQGPFGYEPPEVDAALAELVGPPQRAAV